MYIKQVLSIATDSFSFSVRVLALNLTSQMGSILSVSGPSRMLAWKKVIERNNNFAYGKPFVEMIQGHPPVWTLDQCEDYI